MGKSQRKDEIDEHDQTTEPLVMAPLMPTVPAYDNGMLPAPQPYEQPFPQQYAPVVSSPWYPYPQGQLVNPLPYGPPARQKSSGPAVGVPAEPAKPAPAQSKRRSLTPRYVGMVFVLIQLLLLTRFVLKLINPVTIVPWMGATYMLTDLFLWPFQTLVQQIRIPTSGNLEIQTLLAIFCYGLFSRIIVRFLKTLLYSHQV